MDTTVPRDAALARRLLAADAAFELVLAALLLTEPFLLDRWIDIPAPTWAIVGFGALLVPVGLLLARVAQMERPPRWFVQLLAALNAAGALVFAAWAALDGDFDEPTKVFVLAVVVGLAGLAAGQLAALRNL
jgi:hypothetical protein